MGRRLEPGEEFCPVTGGPHAMRIIWPTCEGVICAVFFPPFGLLCCLLSAGGSLHCRSTSTRGVVEPRRPSDNTLNALKHPHLVFKRAECPEELSC